MKIRARIENSQGKNQIVLTTNENSHAIVIPPGTTGFGSSANGGELLLLALATCYGNDIYREAAKLKITVERVEVEASADFGAAGESAKNVTYHARVHAKAAEEEIRALMLATDKVAEIHNTLRGSTPVILSDIEAVTVRADDPLVRA